MEKEPTPTGFPRGQADPFRTPEGYFEGFTDRILAALPEQPAAATPTVSLRDKIKPLLYLAAAFLGMMLLFKALTALHPTTRGAAHPLYVQHAATDADITTTATDDDLDYLDYLESEYADRFFSDPFDEWE